MSRQPTNLWPPVGGILFNRQASSGLAPLIPWTEYVRLEPSRSHLWAGWSTSVGDTLEGWRCRPVKGAASVYLLGQKGKKGCASFVDWPSSQEWDVAIYSGTPEEVANGIRGLGVEDSSTLEDHYQTGDQPGFGLGIVTAVETLRSGFWSEEFDGPVDGRW